jgi:hypothetical protein
MSIQVVSFRTSLLVSNLDKAASGETEAPAGEAETSSLLSILLFDVQKLSGLGPNTSKVSDF